ncbi:MAG: hypothetical protein JOY63_14945 [Acetobacteraceae bacterium]|nr:hypothetical protein [Acetobacteraceae bacterium]
MTSGVIADWGLCMGWTLRLAETGTDGGARSEEALEISRPNDLGEIANPG